MQTHKIVSREEWLVARKALLAKEKEQTRLRDRISAEQRHGSRRIEPVRAGVPREAPMQVPGRQRPLASRLADPLHVRQNGAHRESRAGIANISLVSRGK